jgi:hypothetical protein
MRQRRAYECYLRDALVYSILPVAITLAGALLAAFKPPPANGASAASRRLTLLLNASAPCEFNLV